MGKGGKGRNSTGKGSRRVIKMKREDIYIYDGRSMYNIYNI